MHITLIPMRRDDALSLARAGDHLIVNGVAFDFSDLPDGATLPQDAVACDWLAGDVERIDGVLHLALILPVGAQAPQEARFPAPLTVSQDGPVSLPGEHA